MRISVALAVPAALLATTLLAAPKLAPPRSAKPDAGAGHDASQASRAHRAKESEDDDDPHIESVPTCDEQKQPLCNVQRLIGDFRVASFRAESLIVTVPDPVDTSFASTFDEALEAVSKAITRAGYISDRYYLPWRHGNGGKGAATGKAAKGES